MAADSCSLIEKCKARREFVAENISVQGGVVMERKEFGLGDIVKMKKKHPCGSFTWEVVRMGADIKIKCQGCGRLIMLERSEFEKKMLKVVKSDAAE